MHTRCSEFIEEHGDIVFGQKLKLLFFYWNLIQWHFFGNFDILLKQSLFNIARVQRPCYLAFLKERICQIFRPLINSKIICILKHFLDKKYRHIRAKCDHFTHMWSTMCLINFFIYNKVKHGDCCAHADDRGAQKCI